MYKIILIFIILMPKLLIASSNNINQLFETANKNYRNGEYENSIVNFNKIIEQGYESSSLYYNLGNAYFRLNKLGYSIYYFEKSLKLDPGDEDAEFNLMVARSRTIDKIKDVPQIFLINWWNSLLSIFSISGWAVVIIIFYLILLVQIAVYFLSSHISFQKLAFYSGVVNLFIVILFVVLFIYKIKSETSSEFGVLIEPIMTVKISPDPQSADAFILHEGIKLKIEDRLDDWLKVKLSDGKTGWIPSKSMLKI